jgi:hypothetical protein
MAIPDAMGERRREQGAWSVKRFDSSCKEIIPVANLKYHRYDHRTHISAIEPARRQNAPSALMDKDPAPALGGARAWRRSV